MVLILHPNDELKIISLQKEIKSKLSSDKIKIIQHFPLWAFLDFKNINLCEKSELLSEKEISNLINSIQILSPVFREKKIILPVEISYKKSDDNLKKVDTYINLCDVFPKNDINLCDSLLNEHKFSLSPKIFRVATEEINGNSYFVTNFSWKKFK